jgi:hypothetical protein
MEESSGLLHQHKVVMYATSANERALVAIHKRFHPGGKAGSQRFRHQLGEDVDKADRPVVTIARKLSLYPKI